MTLLAIAAALLLFQPEPRAVATFEGEWKSGDKKQIFIAVDSGETMRMLVTGQTKFFRSGKAARVSDYKEGEPVTVEAERDLRMNLLVVRVDTAAPRQTKPAQLPPDLNADEIMRRVAENQDRSETARSGFVYDMKVFVRLLRGGNKVAQEETRVYTVTPAERGAERQLASTTGRVIDGKNEIRYDKPGFEHKRMDIDAAITRAMADELMWEKGENTPMVEWFPLTRHHQHHYTFRVMGEEKFREHEVYRIAYSSKEKDWDDEDCWNGEALIHKTEFQPVQIASHWECKVPGAVKVLLGTNLTGLGAKVTYQRFAPNVWFPVSAGGELKLRALFLYGRTIAFTATNSGFRRTDVQSTVTFEKPPQ